MATYPTSKAHRASRRKLGKGQTVNTSPTATSIAAAPSLGSDYAVITFSNPVTVGAVIPSTGTVGTVVQQTVVSPTQVAQQFGTAVATKTMTIANNPLGVTPIGGGQVTGSTITFP